MNRHSLILLLCLVGTLDAQILHYRFDEGQGTTAGNSGSSSKTLSLVDSAGTPSPFLWSIVGGGSSAATGDYALNLTSSTGMGTGRSGPVASNGSLSLTDPLSKFTITGWFRPTVTDLSRASIIMITTETSYLRVWGISGGPVGERSRLHLVISNDAYSSSANATGDFEAVWSTPSLWAFFAISYTSVTPTQNTHFYSGGQDAPVALSASHSEPSVPISLNGASLWIGNSPTGGNPFQGYIDDIRVYDKVLSITEIETIRRASAPQNNLARLMNVYTDASRGFVMEWTGSQTSDFHVQTNPDLYSLWERSASNPVLIGPNRWSWSDSNWGDHLKFFYRVESVSE